MIYIALNVLFNTFVLGFMLLIGTSIIPITPTAAWCLAYCISGSLTIIGYTRIGTGAVGLFIPGRKMIGREKSKLDPILQDVINNTNHKYNTNYKLSDFKIKITDNKVVNAFALGYNTITVNRGAFDAFSDQQLKAIIAHEMGHLYYRDSVKSISLIFSSFATRIIMLIYAIYLAFATAFSQNARGGKANALALFTWIPVLFFLPVVALNWMGSKLFYLLNMRMSQGAEYRADAFAASLGYKANMIAALEILDSITTYDNSFIAKLTATHPSTMQRIGALEDSEIAKQKIGRLRIASPFAAEHAAYSNGNNDVIRLTAILGITGALWCIFVFINNVEHHDKRYHAANKTVPHVANNHKNTTTHLTSVNNPHHANTKTKQHVNTVRNAENPNMVHILKVIKINDTDFYNITYKTGGITNTIFKHTAPTNNTMTPSEFAKLL